MEYGVGVLRIAELTRFSGNTTNALDITVTGVVTNIATVDIGTVETGDIIILAVDCEFAKGLTAGNTQVGGRRSAGTAIIAHALASEATFVEPSQAASTIWHCAFTWIFQVTAGGTLTLALAGVSLGSNSTVFSSTGSLRVRVLRG